MGKTSQNNPDISIVIPVKNEEESIPVLAGELLKVMNKNRRTYEVIFIDDGSTDASHRVLMELSKTIPNMAIIKFRANFGKSEALSAGFARARGDIIITMDADLQDDPREIPKLLSVLSKGYDFVIGWRKKRNDDSVKLISSKLFNKGTALMTGVTLHDFNCGLKAFTAEVARELTLYGELHRFIPVLVAKKQFRVTEIPVTHRARRYGYSKYGLERSWRGMVDLITTIFLTTYATKPAHLFGKFGLLLGLLGFVLDAHVTFIKLTTGSTQGKIPQLLAGILFMVLGVQLISTGLIGEMIIKLYKPRHRTNTQ